MRLRRHGVSQTALVTSTGTVFLMVPLNIYEACTEAMCCPPFPQVPEDDAELEGSEMEALHEEIEADYDMADAIRTKLIPNAVGW
jgi:hypothetical protein